MSPRETIGGEAVSHVDSFPGLRVISPVDGVAVEQLVSARFLEEIEGSDLIVIDAPLLGSDLVAERLIADNRIGAIVFTASARRSTVGAVRARDRGDCAGLAADAGALRRGNPKRRTADLSSIQSVIAGTARLPQFIC